MITGAEAARSLYGAYRLARLDPRGMTFLDVTPAGALRSFWAAAFVLPAHFLLEALTLDPAVMEGPVLRLLAVEAVSYVVRWTAYPVLMIWVCALIDRPARFPGFVAAYNWANVIAYLAYLPVALITASGVLPEDWSLALGLAITIAVIAYQWFVTRTALAVGGGMAAGLIAVDLALSLFLANLTLDLLQAGAPASGG